MKLATSLTYGLILGFVAFTIPFRAAADVTIRLEGTDGSRDMTVTFNGSGSWTLTALSFSTFNYGASNIANSSHSSLGGSNKLGFIDNNVNDNPFKSAISSGKQDGQYVPFDTPISFSASNTIGPLSFKVIGFLFDDDGTGAVDDIRLVTNESESPAFIWPGGTTISYTVGSSSAFSLNSGEDANFDEAMDVGSYTLNGPGLTGTLQIAVANPPANLTYSTHPAIYTVGEAITDNSPSSTGGTVVAYSITPALPAGLSFDTGSGVISGMPTELSVPTDYTVTATNFAGSTTVTLRITVNDLVILLEGRSGSRSMKATFNGTGWTTTADSTRAFVHGDAAIAHGFHNSLGGSSREGLLDNQVQGNPLKAAVSSGYVGGQYVPFNTSISFSATNTSGPASFNVIGLLMDDDGTGDADDFRLVTDQTQSTTWPSGTTFSYTGGSSSAFSLNYFVGADFDDAMTVGNYTLGPSTPTETPSLEGTLEIAVLPDAPADLAYVTNSAIYTKDVAITDNVPSSTGDDVDSYSVTPALPAGLSLDTSSGVISGTPTELSTATDYTVTATNRGGSDTVIVSITVNDVAPSALGYATNPAIYTVGVAITDNVPSSTGGDVVSYSITPALPARLSLDTATGVISGTPTELSTATDYTVTATNTGGSTTVTLRITVNDLLILLEGTSGSRAMKVTFNGSGWTTTGDSARAFVFDSATVANSSLDSLGGSDREGFLDDSVRDNPFKAAVSRGVEDGQYVPFDTPISFSATNTSGPTSFNIIGLFIDDDGTGDDDDFRLVTDQPESTTWPSSTTFSYTGGSSSTFSLDSGVDATFDEAFNLGSYTIGSSMLKGTLQIAVLPDAPADLVYSTNSAIYTKDVAITDNVPSSTGGDVDSYSISPALPAGLSFDTATGVISGTPSALSTAASYVVTATNSGGSATVTLRIAVNDMKHVVILLEGTDGSRDMRVTFNGTGSWTTSGSTVSAFNDPNVANSSDASLGGSSKAGIEDVQITGGNAMNAAVSGSFTDGQYVAFASSIAMSADGGPSSFNVIGLLLDDDNDPTAGEDDVILVTDQADTSNWPFATEISYAVGASTTFSLDPGIGATFDQAFNKDLYTLDEGVAGSLKVAETVAPAALVYSVNPAIYTVGLAITDNVPSSTGSAVDSYSITPALPAGLSLDTATGVISGRPSAASAVTDYTVTATNTGGSATAVVTITVIDMVALWLLDEADGTSVADAVGSHNGSVMGTADWKPGEGRFGGAIYFSGSDGFIEVPDSSDFRFAEDQSWAVSLWYKTDTTQSDNQGLITKGYHDTSRSNDGYWLLQTSGDTFGFGSRRGSGDTPRVRISSDSGISHGDDQWHHFVVTRDGPLEEIRMYVDGQLTQHDASGTDQGMWAMGDNDDPLVIGNHVNRYTPGWFDDIAIWKGYALTDSDVTAISEGVLPAITEAPRELTYTAHQATYTVGVAITANAPSSMGDAVVTYSVAPALPAGLSLDTGSGVISGTPAEPSAVTDYTVTATNLGGSATTVVTITVNDVAPSALGYTMNPAIYTVDMAISDNVPSSGGGAVVTYSISPALPAGLGLDAGGVISGTPSAVSAAAEYTVTATNSGGSDTVSLRIAVNDVKHVVILLEGTDGSREMRVTFNGTGSWTTSGSTASAFTYDDPNVANSSDASLGGSSKAGIEDVGITGGNAMNAALSGSYTDGQYVAFATPIAMTAGTGPSSFNVIGLLFDDDADPTAGEDDLILVTDQPESSSWPPATEISYTAGASTTFSLDSVIGATFDQAFNKDIYTLDEGLAGSLKVGEPMPPADLVYSSNPAIYTVDEAITDNVPSSTGSAVESYSITPALPAGLSLTGRGVISGTPTELSTASDYTVRATNAVGSTTVRLRIAVNDVKHVVILLEGTDGSRDMRVTFNGTGSWTTSGSTVSAFTYGASNVANSSDASLGGPSKAGFQDVGITGGNAMKAALSGSYTGGQYVAFGTPIAMSADGGPSSFNVIGLLFDDDADPNAGQDDLILVTDQADTNSWPSATEISYTVGASTTFSLDSGIGATFEEAFNKDIYTLDEAVVGSLEVAEAVAPADLSYSINPAIYTKDAAITDNEPFSTGGDVASYSITPELPAGLSLDTGSGVISGTPTELSAATDYTVTATNIGGSATVTVRITVNDVAPSALSYTTNLAVYTVGVVIADNAPSSEGGAVDSYSITPFLPAGLSFDMGSGVISGTPTEPSAATDYTVTATNTGGSATVTVRITVNDVAPSELSYTTNRAGYTVGVVIADNAPSSEGGAVDSYAITPFLPAGLSFDMGSGVISGTPTEPSAATDYTVTATNATGSATVTLRMAVNEVKHVVVLLEGTDGSRDMRITFNGTGSWVMKSDSDTSVSVDSSKVANSSDASLGGSSKEALQNDQIKGGNAMNAALSGSFDSGQYMALATPIAMTADAGPRSFKVIGLLFDTDGDPEGGQDDIDLVTDQPGTISWPSGSEVFYTVGASTTFSLDPGIGATFDQGFNKGIYTLDESVAGSLEIDETVPPAGLFYFATPEVYTVGVAITDKEPSLTGSAVDSYSITPSLPAGLSLDTATGVISGMPTELSVATDYTVTATNTGGSTTVTLRITINDVAPSELRYAASRPVYTVGLAIADNAPSSTGGAVDSYAITPSLPAGLSFDMDSGVISGTPAESSAAADYTVTATNTGGSARVTVRMAVNEVKHVVILLEGADGPRDMRITFNGTGSWVMKSDSDTSVSVDSSQVANSSDASLGGSSKEALQNDQIKGGNPMNAALSGSYTGGQYVALATPIAMTADAGPSSFKVIGLLFDTDGDPEGGQDDIDLVTDQPGTSRWPSGSEISYTVGASSTFSLDSGIGATFGQAFNHGIYTLDEGVVGSLEVDETVPPAGLFYFAPAEIYTVGVAITHNEPSATGSAVDSYSITPSLPAGLSLDTGSGVISGTPTELSAATDYAVMATNAGGSAAVTVRITVNDVAPSALRYTTNLAVYTVGVAIADNAPSSAGGAVDSYSITPSLPAGLSLDMDSGVISGTPTESSAATDYTVTATNAGGSATVTLRMAVNEVKHVVILLEGTDGSRDMRVTFNGTGSWVMKSGSDTSVSVDSSQVANSSDPSLGGSSKEALQNDQIKGGNPMNAALSGSYTDGQYVALATPIAMTADAGPSSFKVIGLLFDTDGDPEGGQDDIDLVTDQPGTSRWPSGSEISYTVGASSTFSLDSGIGATFGQAFNHGIYTLDEGVVGSLEVDETVPPAGLFYLAPAEIYTVGVAITHNEPSATGSAVDSYSITPSLPPGLSLDTGSGVISGTPTELSAATDYMVTATNAGGSATVTLRITVNDVAPSALRYATNRAIYTEGVAIADNALSSTGGAVDFFSITPSLPVGLSLDTATGVISGTPTEPSAATDYTVTATNTGGSDAVTLRMAVNEVKHVVILLEGTDDSRDMRVTFNGTGSWVMKSDSDASVSVDSSQVANSSDASLGGSSKEALQNDQIKGGNPMNAALSGSFSGGQYVALATPIAMTADAGPSSFKVIGLLFDTDGDPEGGQDDIDLVTDQPGTSRRPSGSEISYTVGASSTFSLDSGIGATFGQAFNHGIYTLDEGVVGSLEVDETVPPAGLFYFAPAEIYTVGVAITHNEPSATGSAVDSYSITPSLPPGLSLDTGSGVISGTPTELSAATDYAVMATNAGGSAAVTVRITVNDVAPSALRYTTNLAAYTVGVAIADNAPSSTGGAVDSYSITPSLPAGLSLDMDSGVISGTPTESSAATDYTVTATNAGGSATVTLRMAVNEVKHVVILLEGADGSRDMRVTFNGTGSWVMKSGSDTSVSVDSSQVANSSDPSLGGSSKEALQNDQIKGGNPMNAALSGSYTDGQYVALATPIAMTADAGPSSFKVIGLLFDTDGDPEGGQDDIDLVTDQPGTSRWPFGSEISYTVGASSTFSLDSGIGATFDQAFNKDIYTLDEGVVGSLEVDETVPPAGLFYFAPAAVYAVGVAITDNAPSSTGSAVDSYSITPALPAGLSFNTVTGVISGTPTELTAATDYMVTATNTGGSTTVTVRITVNEAAPSELRYATNRPVYTVDAAIADNAPSSTGSAVDSYSITPSLPAGLSFDMGSGVISGTPTELSPATDYTVTATNAGGSATVTVRITVEDVAPSELRYTTNRASYTLGEAIADNAPFSTGGAVDSYSIAPSLPAGLSFDMDSGVISGTPGALSAVTDYTVTAINTGGSAAETLRIAVNEVKHVVILLEGTDGSRDMRVTFNGTGSWVIKSDSDTSVSVDSSQVANSSDASLGGSSKEALQNDQIKGGNPMNAALSGTYTGGQYMALATPIAMTADAGPSSFEVIGLLFDTDGDPEGGQDDIDLVTDQPGTSRWPSGSEISYTVGASSTFSLDSGIGATFDQAFNKGIYTLNEGVVGSLEVDETVPPAGLFYFATPEVYTVGVAITDNEPSSTGSAVDSYSITPSLPAGLSLDTGSGVISGTPTEPSGATDYTVTATNTGGSTTVTVRITVNEAAPSELRYATNRPVYTVDAAIADNAPSSTGSAVDSYSITPSLPAGLSFDMGSGVISGTPTELSPATDYTVTATNAGGSATVTVRITVEDVAPSELRYTTNRASYTLGEAIADNAPFSTGGAVDSYSIAPSLPAGLSFDMDSGVISGTPGALSAVTDYTVTAINTEGSATVTLRIAVNEVKHVVILLEGTDGSRDMRVTFNGTGSWVIKSDSDTSVSVDSSQVANSSDASLGGSSKEALQNDQIKGGNPMNAALSGTYTGGQYMALATPIAMTADAGPSSFEVIGLLFDTDGDPEGGQDDIDLVTDQPGTSRWPSGSEISYTVGASSTFSLDSGIGATFDQAFNKGIYTLNEGVVGSLEVDETVPPAGLFYFATPEVYTVGVAITDNEPSSTGSAVDSYSITPSLPAGLSLDTVTGVISGTPTEPSGATDYTVTATNTGGSTTVTLRITVDDVAPSALRYSTKQAVYTVGVAIADNAPFSTGGAVVAYSIAPSLPAGLSFDMDSGVISGTPGALSAVTDYTVTAINTEGSATVTLRIAVNEVEHVVILLEGTDGSRDMRVTFNGTGSWVIKSDSDTSVSVDSSQVANSSDASLGGSSKEALQNDQIKGGNPMNAALSGTYTGGQYMALATPIAMTADAGPSSFEVIGLLFDTDGDPEGGQDDIDLVTDQPGTSRWPSGSEISYTVGASSTFSLDSGIGATFDQAFNKGIYTLNEGVVGSLEVDETVPPAGLFYFATPEVYTVGVAITDNEPSSTGSAVDSYSITPSLPAGLSLDTVTGVISGTPTEPSGATDYTVTATNTGGSTTESLRITVNDVAPSELRYSTKQAVYTAGVAIADNAPFSTGGAVVAYSIAPSLPAGLSFDMGSGVISGTPGALSAVTDYTVTAINTGGSATVTLRIAVNDVAPSGLRYSTNQAVYTAGVTIADNAPSSTGGAVVAYSIAPSLPAGLSFDMGSGVISGTPGALSAVTDYTVTATNTGGSATVTLRIAVNDVAPSGLRYSTNQAVYTAGVTIADNAPSSTGGAVVAYSIAPSLPAGLSFDMGSGVISGTPGALSAVTDYTVTATNTGGSATVTLRITVNDVAPSGLRYSTNQAVYTAGVTIADNAPFSTGGAVVAYSIAPSLPAGLSFDMGSGVISGTPGALSAVTDYMVTATNSGGSTTATLQITVEDAVPSALSYATNPAVYTVGVAIAENVPSLAGGAVAAYSITPVLPAGLSLDMGSGVISGTPSEPGAVTDYMVTATNSGGSTAATILRIIVEDAAPSALSYATNPAIYTVGVAIAENVPSLTGGAVVAYSITPVLPVGLSLDTGSGVISGTPTEPGAVTDYMVTATNSGGSTAATILRIIVEDAAPSALSYGTNPAIYTVGVAIAENVPSSAGGAVVGYSIAPSLPAGLSLDTGSGVISGTPTELGEAREYTVTAINTGGSATVTLPITVKDVAPGALVYFASPAIYTVGEAIAENAPSSTGGAVVAYSIAPSLPAGLSFDTGSGVISGTPTEPAEVREYTVTATNSGGSTTVMVRITINDVAPSELTYSTNPAIYTVGEAITDNMPSSTGGAVVAYSITPVLPAGLNLDTGSGVISGTPTEPGEAGDYTVTATNATGSTAAVVTITVKGRHPQYTNSGPFNVAENSVNGTLAGDADAIDADGGAKDVGVTYAIQSGNDSVDGDATPAFGLDPDTGVLTVRDQDDLDHETQSSFALVIRATDGDGFTDVIVTIQVDNVPEAPVSTGLTPVYVMTGAPDGVIDLATAFSDEEDADLSYSISSNSNTALFTSVGIDEGIDRLILDFAPNIAGKATLEITATDSDGQSVSASLVVTVSGDALEEWRDANFSAADLGDPAKEATLWGNSANPDEDLWSNAFEFFFGTDPNSFDEGYPMTYEVHQAGVDGFAVLEFERSKAVPAGVGVVEGSGDLSQWQVVRAPAVVMEDLGDRERVRVRIPMEEQAKQSFVRLVVDLGMN